MVHFWCFAAALRVHHRCRISASSDGCAPAAVRLHRRCISAVVSADGGRCVAASRVSRWCANYLDAAWRALGDCSITVSLLPDQSRHGRLVPVPHMEASVSLARLERALRQVMAVCYRERFGEAWLEHVTSPEQRKLWDARAEDEERRRATRGAAVTPRGGLEYANLFDLRRILHKHWEPLAPALGAKKETSALLERFDGLTADQAAQREAEVLLERFDHVRNTVAHSRELLPFEEDLLAGIAGDVGNRVTIYMSSQDESGDFYPRMVSVYDQYGNQADPEQLMSQETVWIHQTGQTLRPGDSVTFTCRGTDPQGRQLDWGIQRATTGMGPYDAFYADRAQGADVVLTWQVRDQDVRDQCQVFVVMMALGTPYHRAGGFDQVVGFNYRVVPPAF